jgi:uncharacterized protein YjbJ (UPF0337 family)
MNEILSPPPVANATPSPCQGEGWGGGLFSQEHVMNADILAGNWKQSKGKIKKQWGKLTNDDLMIIEGQQDKLSGLVQERYGYTHEQAECEIEEFVQKVLWELKKKLLKPRANPVVWSIGGSFLLKGKESLCN